MPDNVVRTLVAAMGLPPDALVHQEVERAAAICDELVEVIPCELCGVPVEAATVAGKQYVLCRQCDASIG